MELEKIFEELIKTNTNIVVCVKSKETKIEILKKLCSYLPEDVRVATIGKEIPLKTQIGEKKMRKLNELVNIALKDMTEEEKELIKNEIEKEYDKFEKEGFASKFYSKGLNSYNNQSFIVLERIPLFENFKILDVDFSKDSWYMLPAWKIQFQNGTIYTALPEEIILKEIEKEKEINKEIEEILKKCLKEDIKIEHFGQNKDLTLEIRMINVSKRRVIIKNDKTVFTDAELNFGEIKEELYFFL